MNQYQQNLGPQSYHSANYRGNQAGHDNYLRADSTTPSNVQGGVTSSVGFRGQSNFGTQQQFGQQVSPQSYHTANYRGDQQGHDNYLRADSTQPSSTGVQGGFRGVTNTTGINQFGGGYATSTPVNGFGVGVQSGVRSQFGQTNVGVSSYGQQTGQQAYHTANYRGDQAGHDNYLRADSTQPSSVGVQGGYRGTQSTSGSFGGGFATSVPVNGFGVQSVGRSQFGQTNVGVSSYSQQTSPQAYHSGNYRGDQAGHDNYLRADSTQPSSVGAQGGFSGTTTSTTAPVSGGGIGVQSSFGTQQQFGQSVAPQSYHTAGYRGNQQGHDNNLRSDSQQPSRF